MLDICCAMFAENKNEAQIFLGLLHFIIELCANFKIVLVHLQSVITPRPMPVL